MRKGEKGHKRARSLECGKSGQLDRSEHACRELPRRLLADGAASHSKYIMGEVIVYRDVYRALSRLEVFSLVRPSCLTQ